MLEDKKIFKLTKVLNIISNSITSAFNGDIWVEAEISSISSPSSGHKYFDLIEHDSNNRIKAKIKANLWKNGVNKIFSKFKSSTNEDLKSGITVLLKIRPSFHNQYGLSFTIQDIEPNYTLGLMEKKLIEIRKRLTDEGIFDKNKLITPPFEYNKIAVISPSEAAGLKDFKIEMDILEKNNLISVDYFSSIFQGETANKSITKNLIEINNSNEKYDAIVIIRGGGSKIDLHYVNEYDIAQQICISKFPVIVGIGHEIDKSLLDEIANSSLGTPSKVAEFIFQKIINNTKKVEEFIKSINKVSTSILHKEEMKIFNVENKIKSNSLMVINDIEDVIRKIDNKINNKIIYLLNDIENKINKNKNNIFNLISNRFKDIENKVELYYITILSIGPKKTLDRGYSLTYNKNNKIISSIKDIKIDEELTIHLKDGKLKTKVIK